MVDRKRHDLEDREVERGKRQASTTCNEAHVDQRVHELDLLRESLESRHRNVMRAVNPFLLDSPNVTTGIQRLTGQDGSRENSVGEGVGVEVHAAVRLKESSDLSGKSEKAAQLGAHQFSEFPRALESLETVQPKKSTPQSQVCSYNADVDQVSEGKDWNRGDEEHLVAQQKHDQGHLVAGMTQPSNLYSKSQNSSASHRAGSQVLPSLSLNATGKIVETPHTRNVLPPPSSGTGNLLWAAITGDAPAEPLLFNAALEELFEETLQRENIPVQPSAKRELLETVPLVGSVKDPSAARLEHPSNPSSVTQQASEANPGTDTVENLTSTSSLFMSVESDHSAARLEESASSPSIAEHVSQVSTATEQTSPSNFPVSSVNVNKTESGNPSPQSVPINTVGLLQQPETVRESSPTHTEDFLQQLERRKWETRRLF